MMMGAGTSKTVVPDTTTEEMDKEEEEEGRVARKLKKFSVVKFCEGPWKDHRKCVLSEWIAAVEPTTDLVLTTLVGLRVAVYYPDEFEKPEVTDSKVKNLERYALQWKTYQGIVIKEFNDFERAKILSQNIDPDFNIESRQMKIAGNHVSLTSTHKNLPPAVPNYQVNPSNNVYLLQVSDSEFNHYRSPNNTSLQQQTSLGIKVKESYNEEPGVSISNTSSHKSLELMQQVIPKCSRNCYNKEVVNEKLSKTTKSRSINMNVSQTHPMSQNKSESYNERTHVLFNAIHRMNYDHIKQRHVNIARHGHEICTGNPYGKSQIISKNKSASHVISNDSKYGVKGHDNTSDIEQNSNFINKFVVPKASSTPKTNLKTPDDARHYHSEVHPLESSIEKNKRTRTYIKDSEHNDTLSVKSQSTNVTSQMSNLKSQSIKINLLARDTTSSSAGISKNNLDLILEETNDADKSDISTEYNNYSTMKSKAMNITTPTIGTPANFTLRNFNERIKSSTHDSPAKNDTHKIYDKQDTSKPIEVITKNTTCNEANTELTKDSTEHDTQLLNYSQIISESPVQNEHVDFMSIGITTQKNKDSKETEKDVHSKNYDIQTCSNISIQDKSDDSMCTEVISATRHDLKKNTEHTQPSNYSQVISKSPVSHTPANSMCIEVTPQPSNYSQVFSKSPVSHTPANSMCIEVTPQPSNYSQVISKSPVSHTPANSICIEVTPEMTKNLKNTEQNTHRNIDTQACSKSTEDIRKTAKTSYQTLQDGKSLNICNTQMISKTLIQNIPVDTTCTNVQDNIIPILTANHTSNIPHIKTDSFSSIGHNNYSSSESNTNNISQLTRLLDSESESVSQIFHNKNALENGQIFNELCRRIDNIQDERALILQHILKSKPDNIKINETHFQTKHDGNLLHGSGIVKDLKDNLELQNIFKSKPDNIRINEAHFKNQQINIIPGSSIVKDIHNKPQHNNNSENGKRSEKVVDSKILFSTGEQTEGYASNMAGRKRKLIETGETECNDSDIPKTDENKQVPKKRRRKQLLYNPNNPLAHIAISFKQMSNMLFKYLKQQK